MNKKVFVHLTRNWHQGNPYIRGTLFEDTKKLSPLEAQKNIRSLKTRNAIQQFLKTANGFFSIVNTNGNSGWMAVDRIRSLPLFYGLHEGELFISDDARWVKDQVGDDEMDPLAKEEFLAAGYVTGSDSLFPKVKQLQAGELVFFSQDSTGEIRLEPNRYYRYLHRNYFDESEEKLHSRLDDVLQNVFNRLLSHASGRTIVVPLSGGYDSRLIVLMLKRLGYKNVIAFSYGRPGNEEAKTSKSVAEQLGIRWEFVPYSNELWYEWYRSKEMETYFKYADGLASLPHIQDWPAVKVLKQQKRIPDDAVFVPGHSADLPAGSRSKSLPDLYKGETSSERLIEAITGYHYNLYDWSKKQKNLFPYFEKKILKVLGDLDQYPDQASAFESWDISERQPKFIVNSLRVYEFFGYDWWIPFWDKEFMDYWCRIKPAQRLNQGLYIAYVKRFSHRQGLEIKDLSDNLGFLKNAVPFFRDGQTNNHIRSLLELENSCRVILKKRVLKIARSILPKWIKKPLRKQKELRSFKNHPMGWYGIHEEGHTKKQIQNGATMINSILASDYIKKNQNRGQLSQE